MNMVSCTGFHCVSKAPAILTIMLRAADPAAVGGGYEYSPDRQHLFKIRLFLNVDNSTRRSALTTLQVAKAEAARALWCRWA